MALRIDSNQADLHAQRQLSGSRRKQDASMEAPATGKAINAGKEDRVSLSASSLLLGDVRALNRSAISSNDGISMAKAGEAARSDMAGMMERMRVLEAKKGNGALSAEERAAIDAEIASLRTEVNSVRSDTEFKGENPLEGGSAESTIGEAWTSTMSVDAVEVDVRDMETPIDNIGGARAEFGNAAEELASRAANSAELARSLNAARSRLSDADAAAELAELTRARMLEKVGISVEA